MEFECSTNDVVQYLMTESIDDFECVSMNKAVDDVVHRALDALDQKSGSIFIIVDHRKNQQRIYILSAPPYCSLPELKTNHFISFQYQIEAVKEPEDRLIKSWLHFGDRQTIRFIPEQLMWFIRGSF